LRIALALALAGLMAAGCATSPKTTVAGLNQRDPEYRTRDCRAARAQAAKYAEEENGRTVVALAGNLVVPFAGTAAAAYMHAQRRDDAERLNNRIRAACTSDPLKNKRGRMARR
jgi:ABC-type amino acid transport substrate-binding protein